MFRHTGVIGQIRRTVGAGPLVAGVAAMLLSGCNPFAWHRSPELSPRNAGPAAQWSASLSAPTRGADTVEPANRGGSVSGAGTMGPGADDNSTTATVWVGNVAPGSAHTWGIRMGRCGENGSVLGPPSAYPSLIAGSDGRGSSLASLPVPSAWSGAYSVVVQDSASDAGRGMACGNYVRSQ